MLKIWSCTPRSDAEDAQLRAEVGCSRCAVACRGRMLKMRSCMPTPVVVHGFVWETFVLFLFHHTLPPARAIQSDSTFQDCRLGNRVLYVRKQIFFVVVVPQKADSGNVSQGSKFESRRACRHINVVRLGNW